jgi:hypothetical protein
MSGRILFLFVVLGCLPEVILASDSLNHVTPDSSIATINARPVAGSSKSVRSFTSLTNPFEEAGPLAERAYFLENYIQPVTADQEEIRAKIEATYKKVFDEQRFIDFLDLTTFIELPVGIKVDFGVLQYTILIDSVVMEPTESFLYASMLFQTPQGKKIHFIGSDIKFSKNGGLSGDGKLMLVGDYPIKLDGDNSKLIIKGTQNKTFVEFDCKGYKQLSLDASLVFSRELLVPEGADGKEAPGNLSIDFGTTITDWNDILVSINVPKFRVNGLKDVSFSISDAVLDFSDTRNIPSVRFPEGYNQICPALRDGTPNLWQGVYLRELTVTLPPQFETKNEQGQAQAGTGHRITFKGNDLIIDHVGFSGRVSANNLIPIDKGKIGNWNFSLEKIYVKVIANELVEGGFNGAVNIPISKKPEATQTPSTEQKTGDSKTENKTESHVFTYNAVIKKGNEYLFTVSNAGKLNFELWKADVTIEPSSYVEIKLSNGKFLPKAHLNGEMTMNLGMGDGGTASDDKSKNVKVAKVTFEALEIQTIKPYVQVGSFSLGTEGGDSGAGGFPIRVNEISASSSGNTITLGVDLTLSLIGEKDGGFAANGKFNIVAESVENGSDLSYRFKSLNFERFGIDIDKGSFKFKGTLNIYKEDPVYGNGISGTIDATFNPGIRLTASAIFGTRTGMRYWYVDAMAEFKSGITVFPGFAFYGFGGGAYYHMKIDDKGVGSPLGKTVSGMVYVPDESVYFGLKATIAMGVQPGQKSFNGDATFEMAFNKGGGLKYINFRGNGYFMSVPLPASVEKLQAAAGKLAAVTKKAGNANLNEGGAAKTAAEEVHGSPSQAGARAQVWASLSINYDFDNNILHGNLSAYINVAGGLIKGGGPGGRAGEAVLHFAPGEWYIYIGRPEYENRFAIEVLGIARLDAYFVIGTSIPDSPPPPDNVKSILGDIDLDYMKELNALGDGAGVGFGASFTVDTGDRTFLMFYGRFQAGLGFDMMLKNYGDAECKGGGRLGINGWYANGQAYAFFEGVIGIKVKIFMRKKKIKILEIGAAVVAQAMLPNPTWVRGIAGGRFSVLGGLVKGKCKFEVEIGKKCEIINKNESVLESIEVLAEMTPNDGGVRVDVFTVPQAVFNYEMGKEYEILDDNTNQVVKFKISMDEFALTDAGNKVKADLKWNDDYTVVALNAFEILPSEKELVLNVVTSFQERKGGVWQVTMVDGQPLKNTNTSKFTTDKAPDFIPPNNVAYSYPYLNQFNFYKAEGSTGYLTLKQGQSYLFKENNEWEPYARFRPSAGSNIEVRLTYDEAAREVRFPIPAGLQNEKLYELSLVNLPKGYLQNVDTNVDTVNSTVASGDAENTVGLRTRQAEGTIKEVQEKTLYSHYFRTSRYNTLSQKITGSNPSVPGWRFPLLTGVHKIGVNLNHTEPFSQEELVGSAIMQPLVQMEADLSNVPWYQNEIYPLIYSGYPLMGSLKHKRDPSVYGAIPTKAIIVDQFPYDYTLTQAHIDEGTVNYAIPNTGRFEYFLPYYMYTDYEDLRTAAANYVYSTKTEPARLTKLLTQNFPYVKGGDYWVNIKYVLPGKNTVSSTSRLKIINPLE